MTFSILALLIAVGLTGPILASIPKLGIPLVVGEIFAGLVIGQSGLNLIPTNNEALNFLSNLGFALLMFIVGSHLPIRQMNLKPALSVGLLATFLTLVSAVVFGFAVSGPIGFSEPLILATLVATSSAAVALPVLQAISPESSKGFAETALKLTSWIALTDVVTVLSVPLVARQGNIVDALLGMGIIGGIAFLLFMASKIEFLKPYIHNIRHLSKKSHWALDLRVSLLILFGFAAIATSTSTSILVAGFAAGALLAVEDAPRRLSQQLIGLGEGFLIPLFFVILGTRLNLSELVNSPANLVLMFAIASGSALVHVIVSMILKLKVGAGLMATAQLGVPAAIATIGLQTKQLNAGQASAILGAVIISLVFTSVGAMLLGNFSAQNNQ